jgi:3-hydroxy acid dehydrogenase / malonic semialdehyde reductase
MINRLQGQTALITGATSGIGLATAHQLAAMGVNLILTGRRTSRLEFIRDEFTRNYPSIRIEVFTMDVTSFSDCKRLFDQFSEEAIDILINNAGLASGLDKVQQADLSDWNLMLDTNVRGLITITSLFLPGMLARNCGHILNVSSIAGHETYPGGSVYCATKHAVDAFTKALKMDVGQSDLRVSLISPGAVETEFSVVRFKGDTDRAASVYAGIQPLTAEDIAEVMVFTLNRPAHVNILDTIVLATAQSSATMIHRKNG